MPKRRVTAKVFAAQAVWQRAGSVAARKRYSYSAPKVSRTGGPVASGAYRKAGRTPKIRGKQAFHHSGGSNVKIAPAVSQILAGQSVTHGLKEFDASTIRGDIVQTKGTPFRKRRKTVHTAGKPGAAKGKKVSSTKKAHVPSFKGHQLTKKGK